MEKIRLNALPDKRILRDEAGKYTPDLALMELLDNSIDQWRLENQKPDLHVRLRFEGPVDANLVYEDDAGGVPFDRLEALVKAGVSKTGGDAIGIWGMGVKVATLALAKSTTISSRHGQGPVHRLELTQEWWATSRTADDWMVDAIIDTDADQPPGTVRILLKDLHRPLLDLDIQDRTNPNDLVTRLSRAYTRLLAAPGKPGLHIHITTPSGREIMVPRALFGDPDRYPEFFAYPPGFHPTLHTRYFGKDRDVRLRAVVGLLPEQSRDESGVTFYGKGRLFAFALKEATVGFGTRGPAKIPASHPTTWRLVILAEFDGPSDKVPWKSPAKWGYNENAPYVVEISRFLRDIAEPYAIFTRAAKRMDILPYSAAWNALDAGARARQVEQFLRTASNGPTPFPPPPDWAPDAALQEVDHDKDQSRPPLPCLSPELARQAARWLRRRGAETPLRPWSQDAVDGFHRSLAGAPAKLLEDDPWVSTFKTTVTLPVALRNVAADLVPGSSIADFMRQLLEKRAGGLEPLFLVEPSSWRPVLERARNLIRDALPDAKGLLLFGSVARGTADRESDIDLLVVHDDARTAQRRLNDLFNGFRHPQTEGPRYTVHAEGITPENLRAYAQPTGEPKFQRMLAEGVWLYRKPDFTPPPSTEPSG